MIVLQAGGGERERRAGARLALVGGDFGLKAGELRLENRR